MSDEPKKPDDKRRGRVASMERWRSRSYAAQKLREHIDTARHLTDQPRATANRFGSGDFE